MRSLHLRSPNVHPPRTEAVPVAAAAESALPEPEAESALLGPEAEAAFADELRAVRPGLLTPYAAELPGARASVLTRLWRGLVYEPLPWITRREPGRDGLTLHLADGRRLHGPHADPYVTTAYATEVDLDGTAYDSAARLMTALAVPGAAAFAVELQNSAASLALSRANQPPDDGTWPSTAWRWEQRIVDGHPYHPNCRSRPGFTVAEQLAYAPEHRPLVALNLASLHADDCLVTGEWPDRLRDGDRFLVPVHPWQVAHVLGTPSTGRGAGHEKIMAHPLMSLRTLAPAAAPLDGTPHIKTAVSARLTSSVRDISVYSIATSETVSALVDTLAARLDGLLHITRTLGAVTADSPDLAAVLRESPETYAPPESGERVIPVAALATTSLPRSPAWLADFTRLALTVCLRLLDLGVALEAHGQNLLVVLSPANAPVRLVYRDLADIRISPARLARHGIPAPPLTGRLVTDDDTALRRKLFGSLITGTLGATAGSASALRQALSTVVRDLPRTPDLDALLTEPLPTKALTLMRLSLETPGDIWTTVPNPLGAHHRP
ncbi:IucA/IucC family siderophore biosynthesis protein [Streptomyces sp. PSKA28]|uniref:IucA/IucC family siderophore biosynthesis protein n=1 Tax=Streptomyces himalayensis subsp. himalayensis TaxID=2756131 RepID=A0A7W0ICZ7_9ACTN|nr:IucA/IucC family siderophore biosynthesis protein [Streptomyces himalayensis subsp. himalayensis]